MPFGCLSVLVTWLTLITISPSSHAAYAGAVARVRLAATVAVALLAAACSDGASSAAAKNNAPTNDAAKEAAAGDATGEVLPDASL